MTAMDSPLWLTKGYLEKVLRQNYKDSKLQLKALEVTPALGKGENFGGILTRIQAELRFSNGAPTDTHTFTYILKSGFEGDDFIAKKMKPYDIFNREMSIYEQVLPKLQSLLREINDTEQLFPMALHVDYERQALIFEDLSAKGFVMANRIEGLDMPHVELILRKLAKMHAASAVLNERQQGCLESYDRGFFNRYTDSYSSFFVGNLMACSRLLCQWLPEYANYGQKLAALSAHYMEIGKRCFAPTPGHVNVLAHGDVWTNNVMFKYDDCGTPIDVIIIDFQYAFWGSPALDLHHFFNTSLKEHMRRYQQDLLFKNYYHIFTDTLKKLHYKSQIVPSLRLFRLHVEEKRFFAFHSACLIQPIMINEVTDDADIAALMAEDERAINFKNTIFKNKRVHENLRYLVPIFDQRGLLEVNQCD